MFKENFFPNTHFGNLNNFVCEFIESKNGLLYLNMIRAIECELLEQKNERSEN